MSLRRSTASTIVLSLVLCTACSVADHGKGRLILVGGDLSGGNASVHRAFSQAAGADATIAVLPAAGDVPEKSASATVQDLARYRSPAQKIIVIGTQADSPDLGADPQYVGLLESAGAFWFTDGYQAGTVAVYRPASGDSPAFEAVTRQLKRGGVVAGAGAGAAMMSDPMIAWGNSPEALLVGARNIPDRAVAVQKGMGLFPHGIVDPHFLASGNLGRLVAALESTSRLRGFGVADDCALSVDLGRNLGTAIGEAAVVVVDITRLRRDGLSRIGLRLTLMGDGDGIDFQSGAFIPAAGKGPLAPTGPSGDGQPLDPWDPETPIRLIQRLARNPSQEQRIEGDLFTLIAAADERTKFLARAGDLGTLSAIGVRVDILASAEAPAAAQQLLAEIGPPEGSR